jgi:excisionase family DNA binding protein
MSNLSTLAARKRALSHWLTKEEAAGLLGCATKTIDRLVAAGRIQRATRQRTGMQPQAVHHPGDVEKERRARTAKFEGFVMPAEEPQAPPPEGQAVAKLAPTEEKAIAKLDATPALPATLVEMLQSLAKSPSVPVAQRVYLTTSQAVEYSGLSKTCIRRLVTTNKLRRVEGWGRGYRYRRCDLDQLVIE